MNVNPSAKGAEYESQGQSAKRVAPGLMQYAPSGLKGRNILRALQGWAEIEFVYQGRRASRFAPGFYIPRLWRLPRAQINSYDFEDNLSYRTCICVAIIDRDP